MKWISIKDRLPEVDKRVGLLEASNGFPFYYAGYLDEFGDFVDSLGYPVADIEWWCEWPELP